MSKFTTKKRTFNYYDQSVSNKNMLHPKLYRYIADKKVYKLIQEYDTEKYLLHATLKNKAANKNRKTIAWGDMPNRLHVNKCFIGNPNLSKRGTTSEKMVDYLIHTHGLVTPNFNNHHFAGFGAGEACFSVCLHKKKALSAEFSCSQNSRNIHLLKRTKTLFGTGNYTRHNVWNNKSRYSWKSGSLYNNVSFVEPKLSNINFHTVKEEEKKLFCNRLHRWNTDNRQAIVKDCGSTAKKLLAVKSTDNIPDVTGSYIRGVFDSEGSITQNDGVVYLVVTQKDPFLLYIIFKYFGVGIVKKDYTESFYRYIVPYKENFKLFRDFFSDYPIYRTDLIFKHNYLKYRGFSDIVPVRKLPEYVPRGRCQLHRLLATGGNLPDILVKVLHDNYPLELMLYYKEIYTNVYKEKNIPLSLLPFNNTK